MKKLTALFLALCMMVSLAACGSGNENPPAESPVNQPDASQGEPNSNSGSTSTVTVLGSCNVEVATAADGSVTYDGLSKDQLESSLPKEHIPQKLAAGLDVTFAFLCVNLQSVSIKAMSDGMEKICKENGINYEVQEMYMDIATQLDCIENFLTMEVSLIVTFCIDEDAMADTAAKVMSSGTALVILDGTPSFDLSLNICTSPYDVGYQEGKMVSAWVDYAYPNAGDREIKAALMNNAFIPDFVRQNEGLMAALGEDSRIDLVYEEAGTAHTIDEGYTFAENALTSNPDIVLFMTKTGSQGIGVNNYLQSIGKASDSVAVFAADCDEEGRSMVDASTDSSASVLRGEIGYGSYHREEGVMDLIFRLVKGELEEGYVTGEGIFCYDSFGYIYDER